MGIPDEKTIQKVRQWQHDGAISRVLNQFHREPLRRGLPDPRWGKNQQDEEVKACIAVLESIIERLELYPEPEGKVSSSQPEQPATELGSDVFLVHGHDVLMTPDDVGAPAGDKEHLKPRARQNVILELGFFMGKLGRDRVCALYKEGIKEKLEKPSDYDGVLYIALDDRGAWKLQLGKELQIAGLPVDLNKAI